MPAKILLMETEKFIFPQNRFPDSVRIRLTGDSTAMDGHIPSLSSAPLLILAPKEIRSNEIFGAALAQEKAPFSVVYFQEPEITENVENTLLQLSSDARSVGVKNILEKNATIYSHNFFGMSAPGSEFTNCHKYAAAALPYSKSFRFAHILNSSYYAAWMELAKVKDDISKERIEFQFGHDSTKISFTFKYNLPTDRRSPRTTFLRSNNYVETSLEAYSELNPDLCEVRHIREKNTVEIVCIFFLKEESAQPIAVLSYHPKSALETSNQVSEIVYKPIQSLEIPNASNTLPISFKKPFSQVLKQLDKQVPQISNEKEPQFPAPADKLFHTISDGEPAILESKIVGLKETLKQKDELIEKLNNEIDQIKDPLKRNVITNIKDNTLEGYKDNISRLENEIKEYQNNEREFRTKLDLAVQAKTDAIKKQKEIQTKVVQNETALKNTISSLEKTLEEQKRVNKELQTKLGTTNKKSA